MAQAKASRNPIYLLQQLRDRLPEILNRNVQRDHQPCIISYSSTLALHVPALSLAIKKNREDGPRKNVLQRRTILPMSSIQLEVHTVAKRQTKRPDPSLLTTSKDAVMPRKLSSTSSVGTHIFGWVSRCGGTSIDIWDFA